MFKIVRENDDWEKLIDDDGTPSVEMGRLIFIDSAEDPETGCITIKAEFPNSNKAFLPGQFIRVNVIGAAYKNVVIIPASSVINTPVGNIVYAVDNENNVSIKPVKIKFIKNYAIVFSGLKAGDRIVTEGIIKVAMGAKKITPVPKKFEVNVNNFNSESKVNN